MHSIWDERYASHETVYGKEINVFLGQTLSTLPAGRLLLPCEGEGRNAIAAARQGWEVDAFDGSAVAVEKTLRAAEEAGVAVRCVQADAMEYPVAPGHYDAVGLVFAHMPPALRRGFHRRMASGLRPGGTLILEGFGPGQLAFASGGPRELGMLFTEEMLRDDFAGLEVVQCETREVVLDEGPFHQGRAQVTRFVGRALLGSALLLAACLAPFSPAAAQPDSPKLSAAEENALRQPPFVQPLPADSVRWVHRGKLDIQFSQAHFNQWAAGGQSNLSLLTKLDQFWEYDRGRNGWDSELHLAFGLQNRPDESVLLKTDDRIEISTKWGHRATANGFLTVLANFRSQFAPGYPLVNGVPNRDVLQSRWMAPGYGVLAAGMDYKDAPRQLTVFVAPLTYKTTWVLDSTLSAAGAFGVTPGARSRHEVGGYMRLAWTTPVWKNLQYGTRLDLFSNYMQTPENIDVFSDHTLTMKVNDFLSTTLNATFLYDHDVALQKGEPVVGPEGQILDPRMGPGLQFREILSVGFSLAL
jgi:hypothetical protein